MTPRQAAWAMVAATLLWSIAGVVALQLDAAHSFEITFWRSAFTALALLPVLAVARGPRGLWHTLRHAPVALWASAACWGVMFTAFMVALSMTRVANVLVTMAVGPLVTALGARVVFGDRLPRRTWVAIVAAGLGIAAMFGHDVRAADPAQWVGTLVALAVPIAAAANWLLLQRAGQQRDGGAAVDLLPAVGLGALASAALTLPLAWPLVASVHDVAWLAVLGVFQLALPCAIAVAAVRVLGAPEAALVGLLEVLFGVAWAWWAGQAPSPAALGGGGAVLAALAGNALLSRREARRGARPTEGRPQSPAGGAPAGRG